MSEPNKTGVLFVCMGNICRSPAGEGVFKAYVEAQGMADAVDIDSAGTIGYHAGNPADARMRRAAAARGYDLTSVARQVTITDFSRFDLVVAMDRDNVQSIHRMMRGLPEQVCLLGSFLPGERGKVSPDVPDPYYGGADGFEGVLDMIEAACPAMLERVRGLAEAS